MYTINPFTGMLDNTGSGTVIGNLITSGTPFSVLFVDSSGNLGQSTNLTFDPSTGMSILDNVGINVAPNASYGLYAYMPLAGTGRGIYAVSEATGGTNSGAVGGYFEAVYNNSADSTGQAYGLFGRAENRSGNILNSAYGLSYEVKCSATGTISSAYTINARAPSVAAGGTITNNRQIWIGAAAAITANSQTRYGIYIDALPDPGAFTGTTVAGIRLAGTGGVRDQILWGTDTNLYRSGASVLQTDDSFVATGDITSTTGIIKGNYLRFATNTIEEYVSNSNGSVSFNYRGYNGGTTQFRDFGLYDGKQNPMLFAQGSTKFTGLYTLTPYTPFHINETATAGIIETIRLSYNNSTSSGNTISWYAGLNDTKTSDITGGLDASVLGYTAISGYSGGSYIEALRIYGTGLKMSSLFYPQQAPTASAPGYVKGALYFDTTLNKLRVGGGTGWETCTSI